MSTKDNKHITMDNVELNIINKIKKERKNNCSICIETLDKTATTILSCGHIFHMTCLNKWINSNHNTCPLCRNMVIKSDEMTIPIEDTKINTNRVEITNVNNLFTRLQSIKTRRICFIILSGIGCILIFAGSYTFIPDSSYCDSFKEVRCQSKSLLFKQISCCLNNNCGNCYEFTLTYIAEPMVITSHMATFQCGIYDNSCISTIENTYNATKIFSCYTTDRDEILLNDHCEINKTGMILVIIGIIVFIIGSIFVIPFKCSDIDI